MKVLLLAIFVVVGTTTALNCPKLTSVPVSDHFFHKLQPKDGFYMAAAWGEDSIPSYTPKPKPNRKPGSHKGCMKGKLIIGGIPFSAPALDCSYDQIGTTYCETGAGAAMSVAGIQVPKYVEGQSVDTDNKTYVAVGACLDGKLYQWTVFTTDPKNHDVPPSAMKALKITPKQLNESKKKKIKPGRTQFTKGACKAGLIGGILGGG